MGLRLDVSIGGIINREPGSARMMCSLHGIKETK